MIDIRLEKDYYRWADKYPEHSDLFSAVVYTPPGDEALSVVGAVELIAFDAGYEGEKLHKDVEKVGRLVGVNVKKIYKEGIDERRKKSSEFPYYD